LHHIIDIRLFALAATAVAAGLINALAGGGTLLTFPALLWSGVTPVAANATSTVALVPGSFSAAWGYRDLLAGAKRELLIMAIPSVIGGAIGAKLVLLAGDALFAKLVPWLILGATILFVASDPIRVQLSKISSFASSSHLTPGRVIALVCFQGAVAIYGGFFGAGIGILMLAALSMMGLKDIHRMNGIKNIAAVCINSVAAFTFIVNREVNWPIALVMACGAIAGGFGGAKFARLIGQERVKAVVVGIGFTIAVLMFIRQWTGATAI
jgi:hypothetical protein